RLRRRSAADSKEHPEQVRAERKNDRALSGDEARTGHRVCTAEAAKSADLPDAALFALAGDARTEGASRFMRSGPVEWGCREDPLATDDARTLSEAVRACCSLLPQDRGLDALRPRPGAPIPPSRRPRHEPHLSGHRTAVSEEDLWPLSSRRL